MTERDQFETWAKTCGYKLDKFTDNSGRQWYVDKKTAAAFDGWQASRRVALDEAANHITRGVEGAKQNGWIDAANERLRCAVAIRKLATETNHE